MNETKTAKYPNKPGFKEPGATSQQAAEAITGRAARMRAAILRLLAHRPLTTDEAAVLMSETPLSVRPRFSELRAKGSIEPTGQRRPSSEGSPAHVWRLRLRQQQPELFGASQSGASSAGSSAPSSASASPSK